MSIDNLEPPPRVIEEFDTTWKDWLWYLYTTLTAHIADIGWNVHGVVTTRYTTTQTILITDEVVFCNTDGSAWTATLPAGVESQTFKIINSGDSGNLLTLSPDGTEHLIGENSNFLLYDGETLYITYSVADGWF